MPYPASVEALNSYRYITQSVPVDKIPIMTPAGIEKVDTRLPCGPTNVPDGVPSVMATEPALRTNSVCPAAVGAGSITVYDVLPDSTTQLSN